MRRDLGFPAILVLIGAAWGLGQPLTKIAVSTGHGPFGLLFWQSLTGALVLAAVQSLRRRPVPRGPAELRVYLAIALLGTLIPMSVGYIVYRHLPSGIMSVLIATVPMLAFPMALALGSDRFSWRRLGGLALGLAGVAILVLPGQDLRLAETGLWVLAGLVAPTFYAIEVNYVGHSGTAGMGGMQVLHGACWAGAALSLPLALATGQAFLPDPSTPADRALIAAAVLNAFAYSAYVWLARQAGATFSAQSAYLVTGFGILWAMLVLGEQYSMWVWLALVVVLAGVALVQPEPREDLPVGT